MNSSYLCGVGLYRWTRKLLAQPAGYTNDGEDLIVCNEPLGKWDWPCNEFPCKASCKLSDWIRDKLPYDDFDSVNDL